MGGCPISVERLSTDAHAVLAELRATHPVGRVDALDAWLVTGWEPAVQVLRDPDTFTVDDPRFSTAQVVGASMLSLDGDEHRRHRQPFAAAFRPRRVDERFTDIVTSEATRLLDAVADEGAADLRRALAAPLAAAVVAESLGLDGTDQARVGSLLAWYRSIVDSVSGIAAGNDVTAASRSAYAELKDAVLSHLHAHTGRDSLLVEAAGSGSLSDDEVVSNAAVLMFGGIETTEGMILNVLWYLLTNPEQLLIVRSDPALVTAAIEESLRLEPAAAVVDRYATRDVTLAGAEIARGDMVVVSLAGANRDPTVFDQPDLFDVRRSNVHRHLAFASGPHVCVGMELARLEARVATVAVLERFPNVRLDPAPGEPSDADHPAPCGLVFRKPMALLVRW